MASTHFHRMRAEGRRGHKAKVDGYKHGGAVDSDEAEDKKIVAKAVRQHDSQLHHGQHTHLKLKTGGHAAKRRLDKRARGGFVHGKVEPIEGVMNYSKDAKSRTLARGGRAGKGHKTKIQIIVGAPGGGQQGDPQAAQKAALLGALASRGGPGGPGGPPPGGMPPRPPMAGPGGPPMAGPPGMRPPGMKRGGRIGGEGSRQMDTHYRERLKSMPGKSKEGQRQERAYVQLRTLKKDVKGKKQHGH